MSADLNRILHASTKGVKLLRGDHYFWILGGHVQKSLEGLLRAVLHALLFGLSRAGDSADIGTIKHVCQARWQSIGIDRAWSCKLLKEMISRLVLTANARIFLLIDALDECDPQDRLGDLADVIVWLSRLPNVKLCVSCRPWTAFTGRFKNASVLHLDRLTYRDMKLYIENRLISAETEADLCSTFRDGNSLAEDLIHSIAFAAQGVFLWVELVVNAMCSEIRTGSSVEQLRLTMDGFPTDLDDYFQKLIFGRIGTTRPNVPKTAAALKLAMVIQDDINRHDGRTPNPDDYRNFWLLSIGHLKPGFSWKDRVDPRKSDHDEDKKLRQTKLFLEEACKDLVVVHASGKSYKVAFLHRTVFDFLRDSSASLTIKKHAPEHFSHGDFLAKLAKLRYVCRLREAWIDCQSSYDMFDTVLRQVEDANPSHTHQPWFLACEDMMVEAFRNRCVCLSLDHVLGLFRAKRCGELGRHGFCSQEDMPHEAGCRGPSLHYEHLDGATIQLKWSGAPKVAVVELLSQALEYGCDPNESAGLYFRGDSCEQTKWERWLSSAYLGLQQSGRVGNVPIIESLLRHGANPHAMPCTTLHRIGSKCFRKSLYDLLQFIVPADCLAPLRNLLAACSEQHIRHTLQLNQRKRAVRSYVIAEQKFASRVVDRCPRGLQEDERDGWAKSQWIKWQDHRVTFLRSLTEPDAGDTVCLTWWTTEKPTGLVTWCVDCQSRSFVCFTCPFPHILTPDAPCTDLSDVLARRASAHTSVTVFWETCRAELLARRVCEDQSKFGAVYEFLGYATDDLNLDPEAAISVLKEWYAKNPIEPDAEANIQGMVALAGLGLDGLSTDEQQFTDETSTP
jgi:hypothetical protein